MSMFKLYFSDISICLSGPMIGKQIFCSYTCTEVLKSAAFFFPGILVFITHHTLKHVIDGVANFSILRMSCFVYLNKTILTREILLPSKIL